MSLVSDVQELLGETGGATFWTKDHIYDALNKVLLKEYTLHYDRIVTSTATCATGGVWMGIPSDVMIPKTISYDGKDYWPTTYAELERYSKEWQDEDANRPIAFVPVSWNILRVWPVPDAQYEFIVRGTPWPTEIEVGTEDISADDVFKRVVVLKAAAFLVRNTLPQFAQLWEAESREEEQKWRRHQRRQRGQFKMNRFRPANAFLMMQKGNPKMDKYWS